ncbi:MAG: hypothetical protein L0Y76_00320 [Ignavibacteria bacterium]|nr:hypothetical protein [Ignavibacteria bacterium]
MKKILILTLAILFSTSLISDSLFAQKKYAQKKIYRFYTDLQVGPSFPYGDLGSDDVSSRNSGYATTGYKIEFNFGYKLIDLVGINLMAFYNSNPLDLEPLETHLTSLHPGTQWTSESLSWALYGGLLGFEFSYPAGKNFNMGLKAYTGYMSTTSPQLEIRSGSDYYTQAEKETSALAYMFSLSGEYKIGPQIYWITSLDFLGANPNFDNVGVTKQVNGVTTNETKTFTQDMKAFVIDTGLKIVF